MSRTSGDRSGATSRRPRLLLVTSPLTDIDKYGQNLSRFYSGNQFCLGIFYLAAAARQAGFPVEAIDAECRRLTVDQVAAEVLDGGFDVLGVSTTTLGIGRALELVRRAKRAAPDLVTVVGGPHVSCLPRHALETPEVDYAVRNEGEQTLVELLRLIEGGGDPAAVAGLVFRGPDGAIVVNPARPYIEDLDALPFPAFDLVPDLGIYYPPLMHYKRRPVINVITTRGCPQRCTFCEKSTFGTRVRQRSAASILDEVQLLLQRHGVGEIAFADDTFTVSKARIYELFELARRRGLRFPWKCQSRVDAVDEQLLRFMRDNGCWYLSFGIESGDPQILETIRKRIDLDQVRRATRWCRKLGIVTTGFFMIGHPGETPGSIERTMRFACSLELDYISVHINTPMPGTPQYDHAEEHGTFTGRGEFERYNYWTPIFVPHGLTPQLIEQKHREFLNDFYMRPRQVSRWLYNMVRTLRDDPAAAGEVALIAADMLRYTVLPAAASRR